MQQTHAEIATESATRDLEQPQPRATAPPSEAGETTAPPKKVPAWRGYVNEFLAAGIASNDPPLR